MGIVTGDVPATSQLDTRSLLALPDPSEVLASLSRSTAGRAVDPSLRTELTRIADDLTRPLQLAVAGAVSAGKSTMINAVLGRPVAPADAGECTRIVTWYEFGTDDGLVVAERRHGPPVRSRLTATGLPGDLGCPPEEIVRLRVTLRDRRLREITVIDTPGMNTVQADGEEATRRLLFGDEAAEHAQALLYVLRHVQRFDADTLVEFRALSGAAGMTVVNTAAVLSHVDRVSDDPWPDARRLAARAREALRGSALDVVPVSGLLAETARCRLLDDRAVAALRAVAGLDDDVLDDMLLDLDEFEELGDDELGDAVAGHLPAEVRRALVQRLHRYGVRVAVDHLRANPDAGPDELHAVVGDHSGYGGADPTGAGAADPGLGAVVDRFVRHGRRIKAYAAMARIRRLTATGPDTALVAELRRTVDENRRLAADLAALRLLAAGAAVGRGELRLPPDMVEDLMRMIREDDAAAGLGLPPGSTAADIADRAREASIRWRRAALSAGPTVGGHRAHDVLSMLEALVFSLDPDGADAPPSGPPPPSPPPSAGSPLDRERLVRLAASPLVPDPEREALLRLAKSPTAARAVGRRGGTPAEVKAAAGDLANRFRVLRDVPLTGPDEETVRAVCDLFDRIARQPGTTTPRSTG